MNFVVELCRKGVLSTQKIASRRWPSCATRFQVKKLGIVTHKSYCDCFNLPLFHFAPVSPIIHDLGTCTIVCTVGRVDPDLPDL